MKNKILVLGLLLTSLAGYLEWGTDNRMFLFQIELDILSNLFNDPASVLHPLALLPLFGQLLLLFTIFQKNPGRMLIFVGLGCIGLLILFMFLIGLLSLNYKILFSTIPFLIMATFSIHHNWKR